MGGKTLISNIMLGNTYNRMELAGAFGDLGTLLPYVLVYLTVLKFDPAAVLFVFGAANILAGMVYKTPVPVQPMKAIGTAAVAHIGQITQGMVWGAGLFSGIFWFLLSVTGVLKYVTQFVTKPVSKGIVLGLGLSFIYQGLKMMSNAPFLAGLGLLILLLLLKNKKIPAIFVLLLFGIVATIISKPVLITTLANIRPSAALPVLGWNKFTINEFLNGTLLLGLAQLPLTLGNGIIAIATENNRLFPERQVSVRKLALTTGLINLVSPFLGGVPMCHGAGGMAGHVRFGARSGGAIVMLGLILLALAVFFDRYLTLLLQLFPQAVLGVVVLIAGIQLASSARDKGSRKIDIFIIIITAAVGFWNIGIALMVGVILYYISNGYAVAQPPAR